jgi:hypothetical protein
VRSAGDGAAALREALLTEGGTLAGALNAPVSASDSGPGPAQIAASGPRAAGLEAEYELLLEMILEGSRLHYGTPRVVRTDDPDLALLLGDQLYALGLARLAALGDSPAVAELADVISLVAQAHAGSDPELADAVWQAGAAAIGWGGGSDHERAKELARAGDGRAAEALRAARAARSGPVACDRRRDVDDNLKTAFN